LRRTYLAQNTSTSLQTTLAADAHLAEGQFLHEEQTLNHAKSLIYRAGTRRPTTTTTTTIIIIIIIIIIIHVYPSSTKTLNNVRTSVTETTPNTSLLNKMKGYERGRDERGYSKLEIQ
jgi:hypothetical protein